MENHMRIPRVIVFCVALVGIAISSPAVWGQEANTPRRRSEAQEDGSRRAQGRRRPQDGAPGQTRQGDAAGRIGVLMQLFDTDRSGDLSTGEIEAIAETMKAMDQDGDGNVTQAEIIRSVARRRSTDRRRTDRAPGNGPGNDRLGNLEPKQAVERMISRLDKDGDKMISKEEAPQRMKEGFDRIDENGDGKLSVEEMTDAFARMRGRGRQRDGGDALRGVQPKRPGSDRRGSDGR